MSEYIKNVPEHDTTPERLFWGDVIKSLEILHTKAQKSNFGELTDSGDKIIPLDFDLFETVESLRDEEPEDAIMLIVNYAHSIDIPTRSSTPDDRELQNFLDEYGFGAKDN